MNIKEWATKWNIPTEAISDLFLSITENDSCSPDLSESGLISRVRLEASKKNIRVWRNNVGACTTNTGSFIRFGLGNDSKKINSIIKSSDLIGIKKIEILPRHVGTIIGQFISLEIKKPGWKFSGNERETAQLNWINFINSYGGFATFINQEGIL